MTQFTKLHFSSPQVELECDATQCTLTSNEYKLDGQIVFNTGLTAKIGSGARVAQLMIKSDKLEMNAVYDQIVAIDVDINDWRQATAQGTILKTDFNFESNIGTNAQLTVNGPTG